MKKLAFARILLASTLIAANFAAPLAKTTFFIPQSQETAQSGQNDWQNRLARMEQMLEAKRKELGVTGMSVAVIKDDKIIYAKGFGIRNVEKNLPVTPETLFPIGSSTKAFTGMLLAMSADEGKIALIDSPKKYLPFFKLQDPEADKKITVRDLMIHNSGLARTELLWYPGVLSRQEVISAIGEAKPTAPLGEKFQYQNVMVTAAGEAVAKAQNSTWERLMKERILNPLGMKQTVLTLPAVMRSKDYALGYKYNESVKTAERMPFRSEDAMSSIAPAGSVYSSASEMAQWLRLMLAGGMFAGKRLVSEKNFNELVSPQMKNINGSNADYGLGWYLVNRKGRKIIQHGGSIDGFRSQVAMMPDEKLGFVILTNSYKTPLIVSDIGGGVAEEIIWSNLIDEPKANNDTDASKSAIPTENPGQEIGKYSVGNLTIEVTMRDGKLVLNVPGQPPYPLKNMGGRRYKFDSDEPAAAGYFVTFRSAESGEKTEMLLEQPPPKRNVVLMKVNSEADSSKITNGKGSEKYKELTGTYETELEGKKIVFQLVVQDQNLTIVRAGQRPLTLVEKGKDTFSIAGAPDTYELSIKRNTVGEVSALFVKQPNGNVELQRVKDFKSTISTEELMSKAMNALGGEENLRKHKTLETTYDITFIHQGITGTGIISAKAPNLRSNKVTLTALGKRLGTIHEYFNGTVGGTESSFLPPEIQSEKELKEEQIESDFYAPLKWQELYKTIEIKGVSKVGDEETYIITKIPASGAPVTDYISTKSFLLLRRDTERRITRYADYRSADGVMLPLRWIIESPNTGEQVINVKTAKFGAPISDTIFIGAGVTRKN